MLRESLDMFRQSLHAVPRNQRTLRNVGDVFQHLEKHAMASLFYKTAIEAQPQDAISLYKYAYFCHKVLKDMAEAAKYYELSFVNGPNVGNMIAYVHFLIDQKEMAKAEEKMQLTMDLFPNSTVVHHQYATFHASLKNYKQAQEHFELALKGDPENVALLKDYCKFCEERCPDTDRSREMHNRYERLLRRSNTEKRAFRINSFSMPRGRSTGVKVVANTNTTATTAGNEQTTTTEDSKKITTTAGSEQTTTTEDSKQITTQGNPPNQEVNAI